MADHEPQLGIDLEQADLAWAILNEAQKIGIISHRHPDPDSIGSNLALRFMLDRLGKEVNSLCIHQPPQTCGQLEGAQSFEDNFDPNHYEVLISVDCGSISQVAFESMSGEYFQGDFINIDHHTSNNFFGSINLVYTKLSSTCEIVYSLLQHWKQPISKTMATCLLLGLYYDTGSFMHSNVTPRVMEIASDLIAKGADLASITNSLYRNFHLNKYHLWGDVLERIKITPRQTAVAVITTEDLEKFNAHQEDLSGLISYVSTAKDSHFAVMVNQEGPHQIKGSLRTGDDEINLSRLAESLGGGGHRKASGFSIPAKIEKQTIWKITR